MWCFNSNNRKYNINEVLLEIKPVTYFNDQTRETRWWIKIYYWNCNGCSIKDITFLFSNYLIQLRSYQPNSFLKRFAFQLSSKLCVFINANNFIIFCKRYNRLVQLLQLSNTTFCLIHFTIRFNSSIKVIFDRNLSQFTWWTNSSSIEHPRRELRT